MSLDFCSPPIVIDNGSFTIKAGFCNANLPHEVFRTKIARKKVSNNFGFGTTNEKEFYVGSEAFAQQEELGLTLQSPFDKTSISNWDLMEQIWHYTFYESLKVAPEEFGVVLTEHTLTLKNQREKCAQIMFETFNIPSFFLANDSVMNSYAQGKTDSLVVNMGEEETQIVPIYAGHALPHAVKTVELGGRHLTEFLAQKLKLNGHSVDSPVQRECVRDLKENLCYVASDYNSEIRHKKSMDPTSFELPDKSSFKINSTERFEVPELYFNPTLGGFDNVSSIHQASYDSVFKLDMDHNRMHYFSNIILSGGSSVFEGMKDRFQMEMVNTAPVSAMVRVHTSTYRECSTWIGGTILAGLSNFNMEWAIQRNEYDEVGPDMVKRKCF